MNRWRRAPVDLVTKLYTYLWHLWYTIAVLLLLCAPSSSWHLCRFAMHQCHSTKMSPTPMLLMGIVANGPTPSTIMTTRKFCSVDRIIPRARLAISTIWTWVHCISHFMYTSDHYYKRMHFYESENTVFLITDVRNILFGKNSSHLKVIWDNLN